MQELDLLKAELKKLENELEEESYITDGYKIQINGCFGKFGNKYSLLYSPELVTRITVTGQLQLLMLIEDLTLANFNVVSANTDGAITLVPTEREIEFDEVCRLWEQKTKIITEKIYYKYLYERDINNYLGFKMDGEIKEKGVYSKYGSALNSPLSKNPETRICVEAIEAFIANKIPIEETIKSCRDITRFVSVRKVEGGAQKNGKFLGKVIRWYYATNEYETINYCKTGNIVPKSEGAKPLMDLPNEFPSDIDYGKYEAIANSMLFEIGYYKKAGTGRLL